MCLTVGIFSALDGFGQSQADSNAATYILDRYNSFEDAVLQMTREEWSVVRAWSGFDEARYVEVLRNHKSQFEEVRAERRAFRVQNAQIQDEGCGCWVEPDDSYITMVPPPGLGGLPPNEMAWAYQGGAGWDVDCSSEAIPLSEAQNTWTFDLFGENYASFYINSKGQLSFGGHVIDWTPTGFPAAEYNQIAGFWQDIDLRETGEIKWKRTQDAVYVNFIDVGYYNMHSDLRNSFQIILTYPESGVLPNESNVQLCYGDMTWAHGDIGGAFGCCGTDPAVAGADWSSTNPNIATNPHLQIGRFNLLDESYNGPYGVGQGNEDGIQWLSNKAFNLNTTTSASNLAPLPTEDQRCDTLDLCLGQSYPLEVTFLGPEPTQIVTLAVESSLVGDNTIQEESISNGLTANYSGEFVAASAGFNSITIVAEDSEGGITSWDIVIHVKDIVAPSINVHPVSGNSFSVCAGSDLYVVAESVGGQEPVVDWFWTLPLSEWSQNEASISTAEGVLTVTGTTEGGCVVEESFEVFRTPFFIPSVAGTNAVVCPGDSALVEVLPDEDETFVDYTWVGDWNGGGGQVFSSNGSAAYLSAGVYQLTVQTDIGCEGTRTIVINSTDVVIPDVVVDPMCGSLPLEPIEFLGGYSDPSGGFLSFYLYSSIDGWQGSFLSVVVTHADGTTSNEILTLPSGNFANVNALENLALEVGDYVEVFYISSNPENDPYFSVSMFNCVNNCLSNPQACTEFNNLTTSVLYSGPAACQVGPAWGVWEEVSGLGNNSFSSPDEYNTAWTPTEYGLYELCFTESLCGLETCYEVEVNEPPTLQLNAEDVVWACAGDPITLEAIVTDPAGVATVDWPFPGNDNELVNSYAWGEYVETSLEVTATNGCGEASDQVTVVAVPEPELLDEVLCGTEDEALLDPIGGDQNAGLTYIWTFDGDEVVGPQSDWAVTAPGSYCVTTPAPQCPPNFDQSDCAFVVMQQLPANPFEGGLVYGCDGGLLSLSLSSDYDEGTEVNWPDGTMSPGDWLVPSDWNADEAFCLTLSTLSCGEASYCGTLQQGCVSGCTDELALNFNPNANLEDGSCDYLDFSCESLGEPWWQNWPLDLYPTEVQFCTQGVQTALQWVLNLPSLVQEPNSGQWFEVNWVSVESVEASPGGMTPSFSTGLVMAETQSCLELEGVPQQAGEYTVQVILEGQLLLFGSSILVELVVEASLVVVPNPQGIAGCTYAWATNFQPEAVWDNGSCELQGCLDPLACNFTPFATHDGVTCTFDCVGCTYVDALNYAPDATLDNGSCVFVFESSCAFDVNGDGEVGTTELLDFLLYYGSPCPN